MRSSLGHIYIYVPDIEKSYPFYKNVLEYLNYKKIVKEDWGFAFGNDGHQIWFEKTPEKHQHEIYHRCRTGLNHISFRVDFRENVDKFYVDILQKNNVPTLYDSPELFPEYSNNYYAVYFEDPDRIKLEVCYYDD